MTLNMAIIVGARQAGLNISEIADLHKIFTHNHLLGLVNLDFSI